MKGDLGEEVEAQMDAYLERRDRAFLGRAIQRSPSPRQIEQRRYAARQEAKALKEMRRPFQASGQSCPSPRTSDD